MALKEGERDCRSSTRSIGKNQNKVLFITKVNVEATSTIMTINSGMIRLKVA
jgi:hypothetical protein